MEGYRSINHEGCFVNRHIENIRKRPSDFFLWSIGYFRDLPFEKVPEGFSYPLPKTHFDPSKPWAMWINHSTYLLSLNGVHILTDPIWSRRCSPVPFCGPKRQHSPALAIDLLPQIDYVLISHDHYDHLDKSSVRKLHKRFPNCVWIVPKGVRKWFEKRGISRVVELDWWDAAEVGQDFKITAVPTQHFSGRKSPHSNQTLWAGYVFEDLKKSKVFYFVGDTGYNPYDFKKIGKAFPQIDLSLIPIGAYSPRKFMSPVHIEPRDAVHIHQDVSSKLSLGMHWKTFRLSEEPANQPPFDLYHCLKEANLDPLTFLAPEPGHKINW